MCILHHFYIKYAAVLIFFIKKLRFRCFFFLINISSFFLLKPNASFFLHSSVETYNFYIKIQKLYSIKQEDKVYKKKKNEEKKSKNNTYALNFFLYKLYLNILIAIAVFFRSCFILIIP